jgi:hemolysin activation/secretion protein
MDFPLRGHRQKRHGILGRTPIGRNLVLANVEWRQRFVNLKSAQAGIVLFYDGARVADTAQGANEEILHDVGIGLRVKVFGAPVLRLDYGRSVTGDGKSALTVGIGQVF